MPSSDQMATVVGSGMEENPDTVVTGLSTGVLVRHVQSPVGFFTRCGDDRHSLPHGMKSPMSLVITEALTLLVSPFVCLITFVSEPRTPPK